MSKQKLRPVELVRKSPTGADLPFRHPLVLLIAVITVLSILTLVTFDAQDPDLWHHLAVGRFIWQHHTIPATQVWTWPTFGEPEVNYAWAFEALAWRAWDSLGVTGLFIWRWGVTLATFVFAFLTARAIGARNFAPFVVATLCALTFRSRTLVRPEGVAAMLLAAQIAWLAFRHRKSNPPIALLLAIALVWANTHVTYYMFFLAFGLHIVGRLLPGPSRDPQEAGQLSLLAAASALTMLVNPFGWRFFAEPLSIWSRFRDDPLIRNVGELMPVQWSQELVTGLPIILIAWLLLSLWRAFKRGPDWTEWGLLAAFTGQLVLGQRFVGVLALVAMPWLARDLTEWLASRPWPEVFRRPLTRSIIAGLSCLIITWSGSRQAPVAMTLGMTTYSAVGACDFIERNDLKGRFYNPYGLGGYMAYRFAEKRDQLPFMSIHLEGGRELRTLYMAALAGPKGWRALLERYQFDVLLLWQNTTATDELPMVLDRDTTWARVFSDDVACVYVRTQGPYSRLARDSGYVALPADPRNLSALGPRVEADSTFRQALRSELQRQVASSPRHTRALWQLATIADLEGRFRDEQAVLEQLLVTSPREPRAHDALGMLALHFGQPDSAMRMFEMERGISGGDYEFEFRRAQVELALGNRAAALKAFKRELERHPENAAARDSIDALLAR